MAITLKQLAAEITNQTGLETEVIGDSNYAVTSIATLQNATKLQISFLANAKYKKYLAETQAGAVILSKAQRDDFAGNRIVMDNPYAGFAITAQVLDSTPLQSDGIHQTATVDPTAKLGLNVKIGANAVIAAHVVLGDDVVIGAGCYVGQGTMLGCRTQLMPNVTVYHTVKIGSDCTVHAGTVLGADGFGYAPLNVEGNQHWLKIPQVGRVVIGDHTEIGASTTIDRGAIEDTIIGCHVIIDNQIQIGHNVEIGDFTAIAAGTMIAGSTKIGKNVTIGGVCAISGHLTICDRTFITGRAFIMKDINEPSVYSSGMPATTNKEWRNNTARYRKLTELFDRVKKLEKSSD
ncbi:UDP-3-O-(3-hydroxymyristoyl)glucosamine N-acyltransferase [Psychrosphaera algicola]|uniref:UDP-3-O-acylglucosamine N-acyltransferase n=1 Tax=Psychrosphaera algicola TaxID=3023714 RepID=A0ABT5FA61_9GAMM|nr:UDP-3-O-(3-hydroxymyristoyl)glucosamine N-acyltransferase [Psychrosphaera sp. G1-22]MDC2888420.1 UDP-3-O-(3-hydroxymyristoyl)glucosamine N-acyltransferase [Psychrosphaera sp. G1-22]